MNAQCTKLASQLLSVLKCYINILYFARHINFIDRALLEITYWSGFKLSVESNQTITLILILVLLLQFKIG